jgi:hypothetical protein
MKTRLNPGVLLLLVLIASCATPVASPQGESQGVYNPNTETTIKGTIEQVRTAYLPGGGATGQSEGKFSGPIYLELKGDSGTPAVYLGPSWFLESKGFQFAKGDQIEVTGSKLEAQNTILAREVKKGDQVLVLRNAQGIPAWSGSH